MSILTWKIRDPVAVMTAWNSLEAVAGKVVTDRLRLGKAINIVATNGYTYRLYPHDHPTIYNLNTNQKYCLQPVERELPLADRLLILFERIRLLPEEVEQLSNKTKIRNMDRELEVMDEEGYSGAGNDGPNIRVSNYIGTDGLIRESNIFTVGGTFTTNATSSRTRTSVEEYFVDVHEPRHHPFESIIRSFLPARFNGRIPNLVDMSVDARREIIQDLAQNMLKTIEELSNIWRSLNDRNKGNSKGQESRETEALVRQERDQHSEASPRASGGSEDITHRQAEGGSA